MIPAPPSGIYARGGKRLFDVVVSALLLVILAPAMVLLSLLIRRKLGSPVLFRQSRPGRGGEPFRLVKFRSMTNDRTLDGELLSDDQRLTPFGAWLRSTSLDELPELWNVLTGRMSLVGPRPLLIQYLDRYTVEQARRHDVRPGLTGLSQVSGRNNLDWPERFALDVWYTEHVTLRGDVRILARTLVAVFRRTDVAPEGQATAPFFMGVADTSRAHGDEPAKRSRRATAAD